MATMCLQQKFAFPGSRRRARDVVVNFWREKRRALVLKFLMCQDIFYYNDDMVLKQVSIP
jgi:hypothetical protein